MTQRDCRIICSLPDRREYVRSTLSSTGDAKSIVDYANGLQDGVKDGAWMQEEADKKLQNIVEDSPNSH